MAATMSNDDSFLGPMIGLRALLDDDMAQTAALADHRSCGPRSSVRASTW